MAVKKLKRLITLILAATSLEVLLFKYKSITSICLLVTGLLLSSFRYKILNYRPALEIIVVSLIIGGYNFHFLNLFELLPENIRTPMPGFLVSCALTVCIIGASPGDKPANRIGRRNGLLLSALLFPLSLLGLTYFPGMRVDADISVVITILMGAINMLFTVVALFAVVNFGRNKYIISASIVIAVSTICLWIPPYLKTSGPAAILLMLLYVAAFAMSRGMVPWTIPSRVFPNGIKGVLQVAVAVQWFTIFLMSWTFSLINSIPLTELFSYGMAFWIFGIMTVLLTILLRKLVAGTKRKSPEEREGLGLGSNRHPKEDTASILLSHRILLSSFLISIKSKNRASSGHRKPQFYQQLIANVF